jgi:hypothetical protein
MVIERWSLLSASVVAVAVDESQEQAQVGLALD